MGFTENSMKNLFILPISILALIYSVNVFPQFQAGRDFQKIPNPLPIKKDGKVEVIEVFWYGCPACYSFEPFVNKWKKDLDQDVKFTKVPIGWNQLHAKLYYTIEALKLGDTAHSAVFTAIHKEGNRLSSEKSILAFLSKIGVQEDEAFKQMNSFSVNQKVKRSIELSRRLKVPAVPIMYVDGKYLVQVKRSTGEMFKTVDYLINIEKPNS